MALPLLPLTYDEMRGRFRLAVNRAGLSIEVHPIDASGQVLRPDGTTLPNLLAAGGAARGLSGDGGGGYLEGNGLLAAVVGGYLAGRKAAELAY